MPWELQYLIEYPYCMQVLSGIIEGVRKWKNPLKLVKVMHPVLLPAQSTPIHDSLRNV